LTICATAGQWIPRNGTGLPSGVLVTRCTASLRRLISSSVHFPLLVLPDNYYIFLQRDFKLRDVKPKPQQVNALVNCNRSKGTMIQSLHVSQVSVVKYPSDKKNVFLSLGPSQVDSSFPFNIVEFGKLNMFGYPTG